MLERLSFRELVRFFFSGVIVFGAIGIARGISPSDAAAWLRENPWATEVGPSAIGLALLTIVGYVLFPIYRTVVYEWMIINLKTLLLSRVLRRFGLTDYRVLIRTTLRDKYNTRVSPLRAERLYRSLRKTLLPELYGAGSVDSTTSLHFIYFLSITALVLAIALPSRVALAMALFALVVACALDLNYEQDECLLLSSRSKELVAALARFAP